MTIREQVLAAASPRDALLVIADALDNQTPAEDPWGTWGTETHVPANEDRVAAISEELKTCDGEDRQALLAELRILTDKGEAVESGDLAEAKRTKVETDEDGKTIIDIPPPNEDQLNMRKQFVAEMMEPDPGRAPFSEAFIKGGPLLLYYSDRDYVMQLPPNWRKLFVEDVILSSPMEAHEMGRDILKEDDENDPTLTLQRLNGTS